MLKKVFRVGKFLGNIYLLTLCDRQTSEREAFIEEKCSFLTFFKRGEGVDSIAVSLFGNMTVETGEIYIITKEYQYQSIRVSEQNIQIINLILKRGPI